MDGGAWWAAVHGVAKSQTRLSDFTFTFHFHALEKETATHSSVLAWRIPGTGEPGGLPSMGSHRVGHDWSDLAAAAAAAVGRTSCIVIVKLFYCLLWRGTKEPLDEGERGEWKTWLKTQCSKNKDHGIQSHYFMANRRGKSGSSAISFSWAPKSLWMVVAAMKLKDACSLEGKLWQT